VLRAILGRFPGPRLAVVPAAIVYRRSVLMHAPAALPVYLG